jgi:hypothetical protein
MAGPRIFISYAQESQQDEQFVHQLIKDLYEAELEPVTLEDQQHAFTEENFVQALNEKLLDCRWVLLVQTSDALASPHVQLTINTALNLAVQKRIRSVFAIATELVPPQEIPPTWTTIRTFDASKDYPRALARLLLVLEPTLSATAPTVQAQVAPPPAFQSIINLPVKATSSSSTGFVNDKPLPLPKTLWLRGKKWQRWLVPLSIVFAVILIATISINTFARAVTAATRVAIPTATHVKMPIPTVDANATATITAANSAATQIAVYAVKTAQAVQVANMVATANAISTQNAAQAASATNTAVANQVNATATATAMAMNLYNSATSQQPALNDPLSAPNANNSWAVVSTNTSFCGFNNGSYVVNTKGGNLRAACLDKNDLFSNFAIQVQMTFTPPSAACGLTLRAQDADVSSYRLYFNSHGSYKFYGYPDAQGNVGQPLHGPASTISATQANTITAIAMNNTFYIYANGQFVTRASASANGPASGAIGMGCRLDDAMTVSEASFQSLKVWNLP